jgi:hypothetical protein
MTDYSIQLYFEIELHSSAGVSTVFSFRRTCRNWPIFTFSRGWAKIAVSGGEK